MNTKQHITLSLTVSLTAALLSCGPAQHKTSSQRSAGIGPGGTGDAASQTNAGVSSSTAAAAAAAAAAADQARALALTGCYKDYPAAQGGLRSLSNDQIANVLTDITGVDLSTILAGLPRREQGTKFPNAALAGPLASSFIDKWADTAFSVAAALAADTGFIQRFGGNCVDAANPACVQRVIKRLGTLLWRRPVDPSTAAQLADLFKNPNVSGAPAFALGVRQMLEVALLDAHFLYRIEAVRDPATVIQPLDTFEVASRLSFFIWQSAPDLPLLMKASSGELADPAMIAQEVDRLLLDPRAERGFRQFAFDWLALGKLDALKLPAATAGTKPVSFDAPALREQAFSFLTANLLRSSGSVQKAFSSSVPNQDPSLVGLLALPGVIGGLSVADVTNPVKRGLFVNVRLLCHDVPPPPPGAGAFKAETLALDVTPRERLDKHLTNPSCATCHTTVDAIGLSLESLDAVGALRSQYSSRKNIDASGVLTFDGQAQPFKVTAEMLKILGQSKDVQTCLASTLAEFAWGAPPGTANTCELSSLPQPGAATNVNSWSGMVRALANTPTFLQRINDGVKP